MDQSDQKAPDTPCKCMDEFTTTIVANQLFQDMVVTAAKFDKAIFFTKNSAVSRPIIEVELTVEGRKRPVRKSVLYTYCPFCGLPYEPINEKEAAV